MKCSHLQEFERLSVREDADTAARFAKRNYITVGDGEFEALAVCHNCDVEEKVKVKDRPPVIKPFVIENLILQCHDYDVRENRRVHAYQSADIPRYGGCICLPRVTEKDVVRVWHNRRAAEAESEEFHSVNSEYYSYSGPSSDSILENEARRTGAVWVITSTGDGFTTAKGHHRRRGRKSDHCGNPRPGPNRSPRGWDQPHRAEVVSQPTRRFVREDFPEAGDGRDDLR